MIFFLFPILLYIIGRKNIKLLLTIIVLLISLPLLGTLSNSKNEAVKKMSKSVLILMMISFWLLFIIVPFLLFPMLFMRRASSYDGTLDHKKYVERREKFYEYLLLLSHFLGLFVSIVIFDNFFNMTDDNITVLFPLMIISTIIMSIVMFILLNKIVKILESKIIKKDINIGKYKISEKEKKRKLKRVIYLEKVSYYDISTNELIHEYIQGKSSKDIFKYLSFLNKINLL